MGPRAWTLAGLVLVLAAFLAASFEGAHWAGPQQVTVEQDGSGSGEPGPVEETDDDATPDDEGDEQDEDESWGPFDLPVRASLALLLLLGAVGLVLVSLRYLRFALRRGQLSGRVGVRGSTEGEPESDPGTDAAELGRAVQADLLSLDEGTPRNAIVATWVRLEQAAERIGFSRQPADTASEFAARALATYAMDRGAIRTLAALYLEARFSRHPLTEEHREQARTCLRRLQDDLAAGVRR